MKKIIILILALIALSSHAQVSPDSVTIRFILASRTPDCVATVHYPHYLAGDDIAIRPVTDDNGQWIVKLPSPRTLHVQIWDDNKIKGVVWDELNLFCRPGTEATIFLDDVNDRIIFIGENAEVHNAQVRYPLRMENFHGRMFDMDMQEAANHIRAIRQHNLLAIDTLREAHPDIPAGYIEMLRSIERYAFAMDMAQNVFGHLVEDIHELLEKAGTTKGYYLPDEHISLIRELETNEFLRPEAPLAIGAITYLSNLLTLEVFARYGFIREVKGDDFPLACFAEEYALADSLPIAPDLRELMKVSSSFLTQEDELTAARWAFVQTQFSPEFYNLYRRHVSNRTASRITLSAEAVSTLEATPLDSLIDGREIFQKLIAPYRGRVIYVDVWGTWCGPCQRELEHLPELHTALEGLDVVYMYLANQSPEELWQKASRRFGLDGHNSLNLRLSDDQQRAVEQYLGVQGYPTYLLIAPDGTILTAKAPRPSTPNSLREAVMKASLGK